MQIFQPVCKYKFYAQLCVVMSHYKVSFKILIGKHTKIEQLGKQTHVMIPYFPSVLSVAKGKTEK